MLTKGMAKRTSKAPATRPKPPVEVVDPRWLLRAGAGVLLAAILCAYFSLWLLFWQGQWQFALHPSHTVANTPTSLNLPFEPVHFGVDAGGTPQLSGWFIPSDSPGAPTALILHSGDGNIADALPTAQLLHTARLNVLLFDYRGYGASAGEHPAEAQMQIDANTALIYLASTRHIPTATIIPVGLGVGASLATDLAAQNRDIPAIILDSPSGDIDSAVEHDPRTRFVPVRLLLHEHFALISPLGALATPKLILTRTTSPYDARSVANPKMTVELKPNDDVAYVQALTRFTDQYLTHVIPSLTPKP